MVVIVWLLDLQLPMQSVSIIINVANSNPAQARCGRTVVFSKSSGFLHQ